MFLVQIKVFHQEVDAGIQHLVRQDALMAANLQLLTNYYNPNT